MCRILHTTHTPCGQITNRELFCSEANSALLNKAPIPESCQAWQANCHFTSFKLCENCLELIQAEDEERAWDERRRQFFEQERQRRLAVEERQRRLDEQQRLAEEEERQRRSDEEVRSLLSKRQRQDDEGEGGSKRRRKDGEDGPGGRNVERWTGSLTSRVGR